MIYYLCDTFEYPDIKEWIGKNVHSHLNIRKCVATLRGAFFGALSMGALFLFGGREYVTRKGETARS